MTIPFKEINRIIDIAVNAANRKRKLRNLKDLKQEIWIRILEAIVKHGKTDQRYIYTVAINEAFSRRKKMCVYDRLERNDIDIDWLAHKNSDEKNKRIWEQAINRLNVLIAAAQHADILRQVLIEDKTPNSIAVKYKIPIKKVYRIISHGKSKIARDNELRQIYTYYKEQTTP